MKKSKSYYILVAVVILLLQIPSLARTFTLTEFLSSTVVGKSREALSEEFGLEFNPKYHYDGAIKIGELQYGKLNFMVQIYVNEKKCTGFRIWASQFRGVNKEGKTMHGDAAEIDDVFRDLLKDLQGRYAKAPPLYLHESTYEGSKDLSYLWANKKYILVLSEWDSVGTKDITLTHNLRDVGTGEFSGSPEEHKNLIENSSGKLPDNWPSADIKEKLPEENPVTNDHSNKQNENDASREKSDRKEVVKNKSKGEKRGLLRPYIIVIIIMTLFGLGVWGKRKFYS